MTSVLALDLATQTGWAFGDTVHGPLAWGIVQMPSTGDLVGKFCRYYRRWLDGTRDRQTGNFLSNGMIDKYKPDEMVFEAPILPTKTKLVTVRKLVGLACVTEEVGEERDIPVFEDYQQNIRTNFIGIAAAPQTIRDKAVRRMWLNKRMMDEAKARGYQVSVDDEVQAIALLLLRLSQIDPDFALKQTPLFGDAA